MKLHKAIKMAKECGLETIDEAVTNVTFHSISLFKYDEIDEEINELTIDIDMLARKYGCDPSEILEWTITEAEMYMKK